MPYQFGIAKLTSTELTPLVQPPRSLLRQQETGLLLNFGAVEDCAMDDGELPMLAINYEHPRYALTKLFTTHSTPPSAPPCTVDSIVDTFVAASEHLRINLPVEKGATYCLTLMF